MKGKMATYISLLNVLDAMGVNALLRPKEALVALQEIELAQVGLRSVRVVYRRLNQIQQSV